MLEIHIEVYDTTPSLYSIDAEMKSPHFRVSFPTQKKGGGLAARLVAAVFFCLLDHLRGRLGPCATGTHT